MTIVSVRFAMTIAPNDVGGIHYVFTDNGERGESGNLPAGAEAIVRHRFRAFVAVRSWEPA